MGGKASTAHGQDFRAERGDKRRLSCSTSAFPSRMPRQVRCHIRNERITQVLHIQQGMVITYALTQHVKKDVLPTAKKCILILMQNTLSQRLQSSIHCMSDDVPIIAN